MILLIFSIPGAKSVPRINQIAKNKGLETAEPKYALAWGGGDDKGQKVAGGKCSISGQVSLDATISATFR